MKRTLPILAILFVFLGGCETVGSWMGLVDTPVKAWAVAQETLTVATDTFAKLVEDGKVDLKTAQKFQSIQGSAQRLLDEGFDLIAADDDQGARKLITLASRQIANLKAIVSVFTGEGS